MHTGIGDKDGKLSHHTKPEETMIKCTDCGLSIRATKRNVEAGSHASSKHPAKTFQELFPGATLPESLTGGGSSGGGASEGGKGKPKLDIDRIRAEAADAKSIAEGGVAKTEKKKKKKEDLSMLFAAAGISKK